MAMAADDIEWITPQNPEGRRQHGRDDVANFFREFLEHFEVLEVDYELTPTDDRRIVVPGRFRGRGKAAELR